MATTNYMTMENFPLFVKEFNTQIKRCPACGLYQDCENDVCEECGEELEEDLFFDSIECQELVDDIESRLENDVNGGLTFHKISVESGYYSGVQFYVETTDDPTEMDNEDCRYYFDMYRSVAIRRYNSEVNKVCRILRKLAKEYGFDELYLRARFSNGEALYGRVENTSRAKLMQAVSPRV